VYRENNFQTFYSKKYQEPAVGLFRLFIVLLVVAEFHRVLRRKL